MKVDRSRLCIGQRWFCQSRGNIIGEILTFDEEEVKIKIVFGKFYNPVLSKWTFFDDEWVLLRNQNATATTLSSI